MKIIQEFLLLSLVSVCYASTAGMELAVKNKALTMLLFNEIENINLDPITFGNKWIGLTLQNPQVQVESSFNQFSKNFNIELIDSQKNIFKITAQKIKLEMFSNFNTSYLKIQESGSIKATFVDIHLDMQVQLGEQAVGTEFTPSVNINDVKFGFDKMSSNIDIEGTKFSFLEDMILAMFKREIFFIMIRDVQKALKNQIPQKINQLSAKYLHVLNFVDGISFDASLADKPTDSENTLKYKFLGSFFDTNQQRKNLTVKEDKQVLDLDIVAKLNVNIIKSFLEVVRDSKTSISINDLKALHSTDPLYHNDVCLLPHICDEYFNEDPYPIKMEVQFGKDSEIIADITDDNFQFKVGEIRVVVHRDEESNKKLLMDFTIFNFSICGNSHSDEKFNLQFGANGAFDGGVVNQEGYLLKIERDIFLMSGSINDLFNRLNGWWNNRRFKQIGTVNLWKFVAKFDGDSKSLWFGGNIDPFYIGKYQG